MSEQEKRFAIRFRRYARADAQEAMVRLGEVVGSDYAVAWYAGLHEAVATLATLAERWPKADEKRMFRNVVRVMPYRHTLPAHPWQRHLSRLLHSR